MEMNRSSRYSVIGTTVPYNNGRETFFPKSNEDSIREDNSKQKAQITKLMSNNTFLKNSITDIEGVVNTHTDSITRLNERITNIEEANVVHAAEVTRLNERVTDLEETIRNQNTKFDTLINLYNNHNHEFTVKNDYTHQTRDTFFSMSSI